MTLQRPRFHLRLLLAAGLCSAVARAQTDVEKPLPNVLLVVDTSGSMEYKAEANPSTGAFEYPVCNPGDWTLPNESSRWIDLLNVMTGSFINYSCFPESRLGNEFKNEFGLPGATVPYDYGYDTPFHRVLSNNCVAGPGVLPDPLTPFQWPDKAINTYTFQPPSTVIRPQDPASHPGCTAWSQRADGILDIYRGRLRFGLMTFDSHPDSGTGVASAPFGADNRDGMNGTWSYYVGSPSTGRPPNCTVMMPQEVGARNAAAPPWEGRMVAFGDENAPPSDAIERTQWIEDILLTTRPYGATPLAGQLADARHFLWDDATTDPISGSGDFGPHNDTLWAKPNCRRTVLILLSDGEPNLDLRPFCEDVENGGVCPFDTPVGTADELAHNPPTPGLEVETFVIGFAMKKVRPGGLTADIPCADLTDEQCQANPDDRSIQACCTLNEIAQAGTLDATPRKAHFPQNRQELRAVFNDILSNLGTPTTRSAPAFSTVQGAGVDGLQFSASFEPTPGDIWQGRLTRIRTVCNDDQVPEAQPFSTQLGDDFAANLNSNNPTRKLYTVLGSVQGTESLTLRPNTIQSLGFGDGLDDRDASLTPPRSPSAFVSDMSPYIMDVAATDCSVVTTDTACARAIMEWGLGLDNAEGELRYSLLGGIYNSSPRIVPGPPQEFLRDEAYRRFSDEMEAKSRSTVLYTSTVDGFLHAFKVAPYSADLTKVDSLANNELWAFVPPAVLPAFKTQFPNTPAVLLDGTPIISDVNAESGPGNATLLQRSDITAQNGEGTFRTVLLQGFGVGQIEGGFFALDVTTPDLDDGGPKFLWQLTRDNSGHPLFGSGATPLITTIALADQTIGRRNIAVAILPGGMQGTRNGTQEDAGPLAPVKTYFQRPTVASYNNAMEGRSLTIVRLDTGEIVRTFRPFDDADDQLSLSIDSTKIERVRIPAPIVGQPVAYPADTGAPATRIFVGDSEGRLWRLNVGSTNPTQWTMEVFFDAYFDDPSPAQPIETQPVVTTNAAGEVIVAFSTGGQRVQPVLPGTLNRVVSVTDRFDTTNNRFEANLNWMYTMGCPGVTCQPEQYPGERVTGRMTLFGGVLYFATGIPGTDTPAVCSQQQYRLFGMDYIEPLTTDLFLGGLGRMPSLTDPELFVQARDPAPGVVFGSSLERTPSCFETETVSSDAYFGSGTRTRIRSLNPGSFNLTFQIGGVGTGGGGGGGVPQGITIERQALAPPRKFTQITSWAAIFE